jgi:hypothetical protein
MGILILLPKIISLGQLFVAAKQQKPAKGRNHKY